MEVFSREDVNLVPSTRFLTCFLRVRWATPAALETGAFDQITNKLADFALGLQIILAEFPHRAVDDALRDAVAIGNKPPAEGL